MLPVFVALSVWVIALIGLGAATRTLFFGKAGDAGTEGEAHEDAHLALTGFAGLAALATIGTLLNFLLPLGPWFSSGIAAIGIALFLRKGREIVGPLSAIEGLVLLLGLVLLSFAASGPVYHHDTGLYHQPAVRWLRVEPVVAGLANLHGRFGVNSSYLPAAALLELPGLDAGSPYLASALLLFFFGSAVARAIRGWCRVEKTPSRLFLSLGAWPWFLGAADEIVPSLSTDLPVTLLTILSAYYLIRHAERPGDASALRIAVGLAVFALTVKLSALGWLVGCLAVARVLPPAGAFLLAVPWIARGVVLSGHLFYPLQAGRLSGLPWTAPEKASADAAAWIESWARKPRALPAEVLADSSWLKSWGATTVLRASILPLLLLLAVGVASLLIARNREIARALAPAALAAGAGAVFWFVSAPDPRFGYGALFTLAALPLVAALGSSPEPATAREKRAVAVLIVLLSLATFGVRARRFAGEPPGSHPVLEPPRPFVPPVFVRMLPDGTAIFIPADVGEDRCGAAPLPCTPYFDGRLRVVRRSGGRIRAFLPAAAP